MVCEEEYELLGEIGRGSFGKVYKAKHDSGEVHAIKIVELETAGDELDGIQQEIQMLQAFNCPQLTRYHGSFIVGSALWISMEYLEGGSLQDLMKTSKKNLDEHTAQWILREILKALAYLHAERKIHRDVKAGNILVAADGSVRLADFGESVQLTYSIAKRQTFAGSPYWMAPEVIMAQDTYNSKADIWSLGVTAIEMIKGRPPYSDMHPMKAVLCIPNNPPPTLGKDGSFSKHFHTFLEQCLQRDPNQRPTAHDLLKHPFMKAARRTDVLSKLLEARKAAEMMKSLFGEGLLGSRTDEQPTLLPPSPPPLVTATTRTTLPASAAAAIAAAASAAATPARLPAGLADRTVAASDRDLEGNEDDGDDPRTYSLEWDFGDDGSTSSPRGALQGPEAAGEPASLDVRSGEVADMGSLVVASEKFSVPPAEAVTPKARGGGSGGLWSSDGCGNSDPGPSHEKEPPPLGKRYRGRRGKASKGGQMLGMPHEEAEAAAKIQRNIDALAKRHEARLDKQAANKAARESRENEADGRSPSPAAVPSATPVDAQRTAAAAAGGGVDHGPTSASTRPPAAAVAAVSNVADAKMSTDGRKGVKTGGHSVLGRLLGSVAKERTVFYSSASSSSSRVSLPAQSSAPAAPRRAGVGSASGADERAGLSRQRSRLRHRSTGDAAAAIAATASTREPARVELEGEDMDELRRQLTEEMGHAPAAFGADNGPSQLGVPRLSRGSSAAQISVDEATGESEAVARQKVRLSLSPSFGGSSDYITGSAGMEGLEALQPQSPGSSSVVAGDGVESEADVPQFRKAEASLPPGRSAVSPGVQQRAPELPSSGKPEDRVPAAASCLPEERSLDIPRKEEMVASSTAASDRPWEVDGVTVDTDTSFEAAAAVGLKPPGPPRPALSSTSTSQRGARGFEEQEEAQQEEQAAEARVEADDEMLASMPDGFGGERRTQAADVEADGEADRSAKTAAPSVAAKDIVEKESSGADTPLADDDVTSEGTAPACVGADGSMEHEELQHEDAEQDDGLTPSFHTHLTPALIELWEATEEGTDQRQAVQDVAMALERLDACSDGQLTMHLIQRLASSYAAEQGEDRNDALL